MQYIYCYAIYDAMETLFLYYYDLKYLEIN